MSNQRSALDVPPEVIDLLQHETIMTLATATPSGLPHAATMVYVNEGIVLYFCTRPDTTTAQHLDQNPVVSFTVDKYDADWSQTKGIQGSGDSTVLLNASEIARIAELFQKKYSYLTDTRTRNLSFFRISPTSIQYIDNSRKSQRETGLTGAMDWNRSVAYSIFRDLPQQDVETVAARLDTIQVSDGEIIVRQGAPADKFFIIVDGQVEIIRQEGNEEHTVAHLSAGQFFGEMAILRDMPRTATVRATRRTTLLSMDRNSFRSLVAQSLSTTRDFDQVVRRRMDELAAKTPEL